MPDSFFLPGLGNCSYVLMCTDPQRWAKNLAKSVHFFFIFIFVSLLVRAGVMTDIFFFCLEGFIQSHLSLSPKMQVDGEK